MSAVLGRPIFLCFNIGAQCCHMLCHRLSHGLWYLHQIRVTDVRGRGRNAANIQFKRPSEGVPLCNPLHSSVHQAGLRVMQERLKGWPPLELLQFLCQAVSVDGHVARPAEVSTPAVPCQEPKSCIVIPCESADQGCDEHGVVPASVLKRLLLSFLLPLDTSHGTRTFLYQFPCCGLGCTGCRHDVSAGVRSWAHRCARWLHCGHCKDSRHTEFICRYAACPHLRLETPRLTQELNIACVHKGAQTTLQDVASAAHVVTNVAYT